MNENRRDFVKAGVLAAAHAPLFALAGCSTGAAPAHRLPDLDAGLSACGAWRYRQDFPEFVISAPALPAALREQRLFHLLGNRALQVQAGGDGTVGLYEEAHGMRWLLYADASGGTGTSTIVEADGNRWGSARAQWPADASTQLVFGPTWFEVVTASRGLTLSRRLLCPEGERPWVFVEVRLRLAAGQAPRRVVHTESWQLRPRFLHTFAKESERDAQAAAVRYRVQSGPASLLASEDFGDVPRPIGPELLLALDAPGVSAAVMRHDASRQPLLQADAEVLLRPGREQRLWFRIGRRDESFEEPVGDPARFVAANLERLAQRLPRARPAQYPAVAHEIPWHAAALSGGANRDEILGAHTLNQGSVYAFGAGGNAAARDSLQHALPLVYTEPELALSVLRNTCSWGSPDGDLPYALTADKQPLEGLFRPSDQNLWALWLAAEYGIATGDLGAFDEVLPFHPRHRAEPATLRQHLLLQYRFLARSVGLGARGHLRILNADWNDMALKDSGVDPARMQAEGSSVLNSAMAAWVLPVFAALLEKLGEAGPAAEAREFAGALRQRVVEAWNGRWFQRAYAPDGRAVGDRQCWLEVQPWAILCGAADTAQARSLLDTIDELHRAQSPLGARLIWPVPEGADAGTGTRGGIWYSINMTLIWAAAAVDPALAWDEWQRMSLRSHNAYLPARWEGTLGGPDSWNSPESARPGQTWDHPWLSMQSFPVGNMHVHAQPLLAYLRLLGVAPNSSGELMVGRGDFRSRVLRLDAAGHGRLDSRGPVELRSLHGTHRGSGRVRF